MGAARPPRPETPPAIEIPGRVLAGAGATGPAAPDGDGAPALEGGPPFASSPFASAASTLFPVPFSTGKCAEFPVALEAGMPAAFPAPAADVVRRGVLDSVLLAAEGLQPEASSGSAGAADTPASAAKANPAGESSARPWSNPEGWTQWSERRRNRALAPRKFVRCRRPNFPWRWGLPPLIRVLSRRLS